LSWPISNNYDLPKYSRVSGKLRSIHCLDESCEYHYQQIIEPEVANAVKLRKKFESSSVVEKPEDKDKNDGCLK